VLGEGRLSFISSDEILALEQKNILISFEVLATCQRFVHVRIIGMNERSQIFFKYLVMELSLNSSYAFIMCYFIKYRNGILYVVYVTMYFA